MSIQGWMKILAVVATIGAGGLWGPTPSVAHPLGNFSISHYTRLQIEQDRIELRYLIDMAEIPTFQERQESGLVPEAGHPSVAAYLAQKAETLQEGLILEVNGQRLSLQTVEREALFPSGAGSLSTLKLSLAYRASLRGVLSTTNNRLRYQDNNFSGRTGWKEIIATPGTGVTFTHSSVPEIDRSRQLTDYPTDLLNSPPQVLEAHVVFTPAVQPKVIAATGRGQPPHQAVRPEDAALPLQANRQAPSSHAFTDLITSEQLSLGVIVLALAVAAGLGAFHALEPGHGKTIVAAYLVGSHGTARHALWLGFIVTATHTAGVYVLSGVTLYASQYIVPEHLYPWLGVLSGLIIAGLGFYLFLQRYAGKGHTHAHGHTHGHTHGHAHGHEHIHAYAHAHAHDDTPGHHHPHRHVHSHGDSSYEQTAHAPHVHGEHQHDHHEASETVTWRQLLALGVTGGIVPCPAALVVLLSAVALQRVGFGLLLIVAFSVGLAAVLIAIGLLMVYARRFMSRFQSEGPLITRWLPLTSAGLITIIGIAMVMRALIGAGIVTLHL